MSIYRITSRHMEVRTYDTLNGAGNLIAVIAIPKDETIGPRAIDSLLESVTDRWDSETIMYRLHETNGDTGDWLNVEYRTPHCMPCDGGGQAPNGDRCWHCNGLGWANREDGK